MLFLLKPDGLHWTDIPKNVLDLIVAKGADFDLNNLEWKVSEHPVTGITVRLALREGFVAKGGILMDAGPVLIEERPTKLTLLHVEGEQTFDRLEATPSFKQTEEYLESQAPGWKAASAKSRVDVRDAMDQSISRAQEDLDLALTQPVKPDVADHWQSLGGYLPSEDF